MARVDANPADVFEALRLRIKTVLSLTDSQCYMRTDPTDAPNFPIGGDYWVSISVGEGRFDDALFEGGGRNQCTVYFDCITTIFTRIQLDQTDHDEILMFNASRGLYRVLSNLLSSLAEHDLEVGGNNVLREPLPPTGIGYPTKGSPPGYEGEHPNLAWLSVNWRIGFDWLLP